MVLFQFLVPFAKLETNSKEQEFYDTEKHGKGLEILTLAEGICLLLCPS